MKCTLDKETGKMIIGENVPFVRVRRITGYLSPVQNWNNAKRAELKDRVKHGIISAINERVPQACSN